MILPCFAGYLMLLFFMIILSNDVDGFSVKEAKLPAHRAGLPGNVDMITGSALLPASA
jgi:hypothetical protein